MKSAMKITIPSSSTPLNEALVGSSGSPSMIALSTRFRIISQGEDRKEGRRVSTLNAQSGQPFRVSRILKIR